MGATKDCVAADQVHTVAWLLGEANHADHHVNSRRAHRPSLDLPYWLFLKPLASLGLIWDEEGATKDVAGWSRAARPPYGRMCLELAPSMAPLPFMMALGVTHGTWA